MSEDTDRIRAALSNPRDVAGRFGLLEHAKRQARGGVLVVCPAHAERTASLSLTLAGDRTLRIKCFGCGLAGDVFDLVAACMGIDRRPNFRRVFLEAARLASIELRETSLPRESAYNPSSPAPTRLRAAPELAPLEPHPPRCDSVVRLDALAFHDVATAIVMAGQNVKARHATMVMEYLEARGVLGAAKVDGWCALPPMVEVKGISAEAFHASGMLMRSGTEWTHGGHRLVIPWRGPDGRITSLERRRVQRDDDGDMPRYVMPNGYRPLWPFGVDRLAESPMDAPIAFVEGAIDALAVRVLARGPVVPLGIPGTGNWREEWAELGRGRRVLVATDADGAGDEAAEQIARAVGGVAVDVRRVRPREEKDWAAMLVRRLGSVAEQEDCRGHRRTAAVTAHTAAIETARFAVEEARTL